MTQTDLKTSDLCAHLDHVMAPHYQQIIDLAFIQALVKAQLSPKRFQDYLYQDTLYLKEYMAITQHIAQDLMPEIQVQLQQFNQNTEHELGRYQHYLLEQHYQAPQQTSNHTCQAYLDHLWQAAKQGTLLGLVALYPCFHLYRAFAIALSQQLQANNVDLDKHPYGWWLQGLCCDLEHGFIIEVINDLFTNHPHPDKEALTKAAIRSAELEIVFFDNSLVISNVSNIIIQSILIV